MTPRLPIIPGRTRAGRCWRRAGALLLLAVVACSSPRRHHPPADAALPADAGHSSGLEIDFDADHRASVYVGGVIVGVCADGPSLADTLRAVRQRYPELEGASIRLPMVFGYEVADEFWRALDEAGYVSLFGQRLVRGSR